jgi:3-hydroxybutyryl-CoA dehydrogenase
MQIEDVRRVAVVGAGTMGQQIAFQCAGHGYDVVVYDVNPTALEQAGARIDAYAGGLEAGGMITAEQRTSARARITLTPDRATAAGEADVLSEAVPEDPDLKGRVLAGFHAACPSRTVFMTNTSTLVPSQFAKASRRPDRLLALHFHLPVWVNNLVDVMPHAGTDPEVTRLVLAFARRIGQVPIGLNREWGGYVFNTMYGARGALDAVGLDTVWTITDYWARQLGDEQLKANATFLKAYVDRGDLGVKSGRGFYTYPDPAYAQPGFIKTPDS